MNETLCEKQNLKILSVGSLFVLKTKYMYVLIINIVPDNTICFFLKKKPPTLCHLIWYALCVHKKQNHFVCVSNSEMQAIFTSNYMYYTLIYKISNFCSLKNWLRHSTFFH